MRRFSERHSTHTLTEINVTPLLDLAFVLLVIFMITTPLLENSMNLVVPTSAASSQTIDSSQVQTIGITKDNQLTLNNQPIDQATLEQRLVDWHAEKPDAPVIVRPHRDLPVQSLVKVMDLLQRVKIAKVGVATRSDEP